MLFFITVSVLIVSANAKFYTDCGNYYFIIRFVFKYFRLGDTGNLLSFISKLRTVCG